MGEGIGLDREGRGWRVAEGSRREEKKVGEDEILLFRVWWRNERRE